MLSWERLDSARAHAKAVTSVACAPHSGVCFTASYDGDVRVWPPGGAETSSTLLSPGGGPLMSLLVRPMADDTLVLATGDYARRLRAWRLHANPPHGLFVAEPFLVTRQHTGWVRALAAGGLPRQPGAPSARLAYSIGCNRILCWALDGDATYGSSGFCEPDAELALYEDDACVRSHDILCLAHGDDAETLSCGSVDGAIRCWSTSELSSAGGLLQRSPSRWIGHEGRVAALAWPDDASLLSVGYDGFVRRWRRAERGGARGTTGAGWSLAAERRVVNGADRGRALCIANSRRVRGSDRKREVVVVGTSEGDLVALSSSDLSEEAPSRIRIEEGARVTAAVAIGGNDDGSGDETFMVGTSTGHVHRLALRDL